MHYGGPANAVRQQGAASCLVGEQNGPLLDPSSVYAAGSGASLAKVWLKRAAKAPGASWQCHFTSDSIQNPIHTYIHTYIRTYIHTYIHTCTVTLRYLTCGRTDGRTGGRTDRRTVIEKYIKRCTHGSVFVCVYIYIHKYGRERVGQREGETLRHPLTTDRPRQPRT